MTHFFISQKHTFCYDRCSMKTRHGQLKTRRQKKRIFTSRVVKIILFLLVFGGFVYLMNQEYFFVKTISVSGNEVLVTDDIENNINDYMSEKRYFIFPRKNHFFLNTEKLENDLQTIFPRINTLDISLVKGGDILQVEIEERKAHSLWCNNREYESVLDEQCYYADQNGYIYSQSPYFSVNVFPKIFLPAGDILEKRNIYDELDFTAFFGFLDFLSQNHDIKVHHIEKDVYGDVYVYFWRIQNHVFNSNFPFIVYSEKNTYNEVLQNLGVTLNHESFTSSFRANPKQLESIDIRFRDRVFFTFN